MSADFSRGTATGTDASPMPANAPPHKRMPPRRVSGEDRLFGIFAHLGAIVSGFLAPLVLYLIQQDRRSLPAWHAREAFNFQLSLMLYAVLSFSPLCLGFLELDPMVWLVIITLDIVLIAAVLLFGLAVMILASIAANRGDWYRYPLNIPFIPRPPISFATDDHADLD